MNGKGVYWEWIGSKKSFHLLTGNSVHYVRALSTMKIRKNKDDGDEARNLRTAICDGLRNLQAERSCSFISGELDFFSFEVVSSQCVV